MHTGQRQRHYTGVTFRLLLALFAIFLILIVAQALVNANRAVDTLEQEEKQGLAELYTLYNNEIDLRQKSAETLSISIADRADVQNIYLTKDRDGLLALLTPLFNTLKTDYDIVHLYIENLDGTVFVRVHNPAQYGDDITYRRTAAAALENVQTISGVEIGPNRLGVRSVTPMFEAGEFIGLVEVGLDYDEPFINSLKERYGADFRMWVSHEAAAPAGLKPVEGVPNSPISELFFYAGTQTTPLPIPAATYEQVLNTGDPQTVFVTANGEELSVLVSPLLAYGDRIIGVLEIVTSRQADLAALRTDVFSSIAKTGVFALVGFVLVALIINGMVLRPLTQLNETAEKWRTGDLSVRVTHLPNNEFGLLGHTYNTVAEELESTLKRQEQVIQERTRALETSSQISRNLSKILDTEQLIQEVVTQIQNAFNYYHVHIYLLDEEGNRLVMAGGTGEAGRIMLAQEHQIEVDKGLVGRAATRNSSVLVPDVTQEPGWLPNTLLPDTCAEVAVPIAIGDRVLGVLDVQQNIKNNLTGESVELLESIASQVAIALQNARLFNELQEAEEETALFKFGIEQSSAGVFLTQVDGTITYVNPAFEKIYGYTAEEAIGQTPRILKSGVIPPAQYESFWNSLLAQEVVAGEIINKAKDGRLIPIDGSNNPIVTPEGKLVGFLTIQTDITERKRVDAALTKQAQDLQTVVEVSTAVNAILDQNELLQAVTNLTKERFNLYHSQIYLVDDSGTNLVLVAGAGEVGQQMVAAKHTIPLAQELSLVARAARDKKGVVINDTQTDPGFLANHLLPETRSEMSVPMIVGNQVLGVLDVQADVVDRFSEQDVQIKTTLAAQTAVALQNTRQYAATNRAQQIVQKNEALMRTIIDSTPDWIFVKDVDHRYVLVNKGYANTFHMTPEDFIGKNDLEIGFPEEIVKGNPEKGIRGFWADDRQIMAEGELKVIPEEPAVVDNQPRVLSTIKAPLKDELGNSIGVVGFVHDITDLKSVEETLRQNQAQLQQALHTARMANWQIDLPTLTFTFNDPVYELLGTSATKEGGYEKPLHHFLAEFVHPEDKDMLTSTVQELLIANRMNTIEKEIRILLADKEEREMLIRFDYLGADSQQPDTIFGTVQDIHEQKQAQLAREQLTRELEERVEQMNALQRAMSLEGWQEFLTTGNRPVQGFMFADETILPIQPGGLNDQIKTNAPILLEEIKEISFNETHTAVSVPLNLYGESIGIIGVRSKSGESLSDEQEALLMAFSTQVVEALERARLFEETEIGRQRLDIQARELAVINEVAQSVSQLLEPADLLETIFKQVQRAVVADAFIVASYDPRTNLLSYPLVYDGGRRYQPPAGRPAADNPWLRVVQTGQPQLINRTEEEVALRLAELKDSAEHRLGAPGKVSASLIFVPLFLGQQAIGALSVQSYEQAAYSEHDLALLAGIANHVAVALENARLYTETQRRAEREALVNAISQKIQNASTIESAMQTAVAELGKAFQVKRAIVELNHTKPLPEIS